MADGYDWTIDDTYAAQTMCPYVSSILMFICFPLWLAARQPLRLLALLLLAEHVQYQFI